MAITTLSGLKDGLQPTFHFLKSSVNYEATGLLASLAYAAGSPAAAATPSPGIDGAALTSYAGQIPWVNPASGSGYVASINSGLPNSASGFVGMGFVYDRLWHNSGITVTTTTEQAISSPIWPARDRGGSTNGDGVFVAIETSAAMGNGTITNTTLNYTNSAGTSGRTGTITSVSSTLQANTFIPFHLQEGDVGVRSVQGLTLGTSYVSGTMHLVAFRPICEWFSRELSRLCMATAFQLAMPRVYDDSVLFATVINNASSTSTQIITLQPAHG